MDEAGTIARESIRRLLSLYCDAVMRGDADALGPLFTADARVRIADGPERVGRGEIVEGFRRTAAGYRFLHQKCDTGLIDVDGDAARARVGVMELNQPQASEALAVVFGAYEDEYRRAEARWHFHRRRFRLQCRFVLPASEIGHFAFAPELRFLP